MTTKKSFFILIKLIFVVFSILFIKDAFYKWDGYSYYMRFRDFIPDLSLAYLLWSVLGILYSLVIVFFASLAYKLFLFLSCKIRLADIVFWSVISFLFVIIKVGFFSHISISGLTGLNHAMILALGMFISVAAVWSMRRYNERIIDVIGDRITPLVWLFAFLLIVSVPFSFIRSAGSNGKYDEDIKMYKSAADSPNIILVIWDALAAKDVSAYGYGLPTTPFLSEWAKGSMIFNRAYSPSNWTGSSVMSIMTGQRVWTHKVWHFIANSLIVDDYPTSLPAVLKDNGYDVYAFVQNSFAHPQKLGLSNAFMVSDKWHTFAISGGWWFDNLTNHFVNRPVVKEWIFEGNMVSNIIDIFRPSINTTLVPSEKVYNRFLEFMSQRNRIVGRDSSATKRNSMKPFFAYLHVYPPHTPYLPPQPFMGMFGDSHRFTVLKEEHESGLVFNNYGPERQGDVDILRKRYDEFIAYSDFQFKSFMSALPDTVDMSNTIIILTSDHGESFSHGWVGHGGPYFHEDVVHVPLIIKAPFLKEGRVVEQSVSLDGIAPTILDLAGITVPNWMEGESLFGFLSGISPKPIPVFSMWFGNNRGFGEKITKGVIAVWEGDFKLVYNLDQNIKLLYDLRSDPLETVDISGENPSKAGELLKLINDRLYKAEERK